MSSRIEELVYEAYYLNKRMELFNNVSNIRDKHPNMLLEDVYELAYKKIIEKND